MGEIENFIGIGNYGKNVVISERVNVAIISKFHFINSSLEMMQELLVSLRCWMQSKTLRFFTKSAIFGCGQKEECQSQSTAQNQSNNQRTFKQAFCKGDPPTRKRGTCGLKDAAFMTK